MINFEVEFGVFVSVFVGFRVCFKLVFWISLLNVGYIVCVYIIY